MQIADLIKILCINFHKTPNMGTLNTNRNPEWHIGTLFEKGPSGIPVPNTRDWVTKIGTVSGVSNFLVIFTSVRNNHLKRSLKVSVEILFIMRSIYILSDMCHVRCQLSLNQASQLTFCAMALTNSRNQSYTMKRDTVETRYCKCE